MAKVELEVGDLVKLKSGGPVMTVEFIGPRATPDMTCGPLPEDQCQCIYFDAGNSIWRRVYSKGSLVLAT